MRLHNPTNKRLYWIAKRFPPPVLYDTIMAFAEANAMHALGRDIADQRETWQLPSTGERVDLTANRQVLPMHGGEVEIPFSFLSPQRAVELVEQYMRTSGRAEMQRGSTRYDRYLPWVAKTLNEVHRQQLRSARAMVRRPIEPGLVLDAYTQAVRRAILLAPDIDDSYGLSHQYREPLRQRPDGSTYRMASGAEGANAGYRRAAQALTTGFRGIVDWAEHDTVDLNQYDLTDALESAEEHAGWAAEQEEMAAVPEGRTVYEWPDGWTVQELLTQHELVVEGTLLRHCVKDYEESDLVVGGGTSRVYSLRDEENQPVATMEWDTADRRVPSSGLRGFANKVPDLDQLSRLYEFRRRCRVFDTGWEKDEHVTYPVNRGENWGGRYERRTGLDRNGNSLYESVDVYPMGVYESEPLEWALAAHMESLEHSSWEAEYEGCLESDFPDWKALHGDAECEPAAEWADQESLRLMEEFVLHFDPSDDLADEIKEYDFEAGKRSGRLADATKVPWGKGSIGDLAWLHWLVTGEDLPGWDAGDEMVDWLNQIIAARVVLPGMPPLTYRGPDSESHTVTGPSRGGWARSIVKGPQGLEVREQELHPAGSPVGDWCVSSDLVDARDY